MASAHSSTYEPGDPAHYQYVLEYKLCGLVRAAVLYQEFGYLHFLLSARISAGQCVHSNSYLPEHGLL